MPANNGGNDPTPGPWGPPGDRCPGNRPDNPWGPGARPGPASALPDLEALAARANATFRSLLGGGGGGNGPRPGRPPLPRAGGRSILLLGALAVAIWLASGFYRVQPDEQGIVLRFGAFVRTALPGLNYHLPWPVETVLTPAVTRINRVQVGYAPATSLPLSRMTRGGEVPDSADQESLQSVPAESLMLTGDENIIDIDFAVFWRIRDAGQYLFDTRHPDQTVKQVAESVMREVIGRTAIQPALTEARARIETDVRAGMQAILDQYKSGVEITQVQLQKVDPPAEVIESFRDVQRANTDAETARNKADSYRNDIIPRARGDAASIVAAAEGARLASIAQAKGQAQQFSEIDAAYQAAKEITLRRLYIETMQALVAKTPTTVVDSGLSAPLPLLNLGQATPPAPKAAP